MQCQTYPISLLLSTKVKNLSGLAHTMGVSADTIKRELKKAPITSQDMLELCKKAFVGKKLKLIADDVILLKEYAKVIEGVQLHYYAGKRIHVKSYCVLVVALSDGKTIIPTSFKLYMGKGMYTKSELLIQLLEELKSQVDIDMVLADDHYSTVQMLTWLIENGIKFEMRMHSNRKVHYKGQWCQIRELKNLKPKGKRRCRTICVNWYGLKLYITAVKYVSKLGKVTFKYQVSNYKSSANTHVLAYKQRWAIEKFFRTGKQSLGLQDCVMRSLQDQFQHIMNVFYAYSILQLELRKSRSFINPEGVVKHYRSKKCKYLKQRIRALAQNYGFAHA